MYCELSNKDTDINNKIANNKDQKNIIILNDIKSENKNDEIEEEKDNIESNNNSPNKINHGDNNNKNKNKKFGGYELFRASTIKNAKKIAKEAGESQKKKEEGEQANKTIEFPSSLSLEELSQISNQMMKSICRIEFNGKNCTGSFVKINYNYQSINCLLTNNEILNDNFIQNNKEIKVFLNNGKKEIKIGINTDKIKYVNNSYNFILIELKENEEINDFLELDKRLLGEYGEIKELKKSTIKYKDYPKDFFRKKSIYIPHYINKNIFVSFGLIKDFNDFEIIHFCNVSDDANGPSGSPIIDMENKTVIGIYNHNKKFKNQRYGIFLELGIKDFVKKNINNFKYNLLRDSIKQEKDIEKMNIIKLIVKVDEKQLNKNIFFLDNYTTIDEVKNKYPHDNLKELNKDNVEMLINRKKVEYSKSFIPEKCENEILIKFKNPMKDCSYMFYGCSNIAYIDLSLFNTKEVTNMECMFGFCTNLKYIDLSFLDTKNVENMIKAFFYCSNLEKIKLNYLGNDKTDVKKIFHECNSFKTLDLSNLKVDDEFDIELFLLMNEKLKKIIIKKECKDKFKDCSIDIEYI